jgi:hypothetical protein
MRIGTAIVRLPRAEAPRVSAAGSTVALQPDPWVVAALTEKEPPLPVRALV